MGVLCFVLALICIIKCTFLFYNLHNGEERTRCLTLNVFLVSCDYYCSVALPLDAMG